MSQAYEKQPEHPERQASGLPLGVSARVQFGVALIAGLAAGGLCGFLGSWPLAPLVAWDVAALVYIVWIGAAVLPLDEAQTRRVASLEDPGRAGANATLIVASLASLVAVGFALAQAAQSSGIWKDLLAGLGVLSVAISWMLVHTIFTLRYARLYYTPEPDGGIDFHAPEPPCYMDFAYLAFTVGMTFQVSDTNLETKKMRRTVLHHALLSYLFGTVIVATTINLIAGLSTK
jgi:uncharacterized membrane protein